MKRASRWQLALGPSSEMALVKVHKYVITITGCEKGRRPQLALGLLMVNGSFGGERRPWSSKRLSYLEALLHGLEPGSERDSDPNSTQTCQDADQRCRLNPLNPQATFLLDSSLEQRYLQGVNNLRSPNPPVSACHSVGPNDVVCSSRNLLSY